MILNLVLAVAAGRRERGIQDELLKAARARGVIIIHAPAGVIGFYKDAPARKQMIDAPQAEASPADSQAVVQPANQWFDPAGNWCSRR